MLFSPVPILKLIIKSNLLGSKQSFHKRIKISQKNKSIESPRRSIDHYELEQVMITTPSRLHKILVEVLVFSCSKKKFKEILN